MNVLYSIMRFISFGFQLSRFRYFHARNKQMAAQARQQRAAVRAYQHLTRKPACFARKQVYNQLMVASENRAAAKRLLAFKRGIQP